MATLISSIGTTSFDSAGKHRLAERLGQMLSDDSLWYTVRAGPSKPPHRVRKPSGDYHPGADAIQVMTMKVSKDLEFPVVALPGVGHMPPPGEDEKEAARVFYVAATRTTQRFVMTHSASSNFSKFLSN